MDWISTDQVGKPLGDNRGKLPGIRTLFEDTFARETQPKPIDTTNGKYVARAERERNFSPPSVPEDFHQRLETFTYPGRSNSMNDLPQFSKLPEIRSTRSNQFEQTNFSPGLSISVDNRLPPISSIFSISNQPSHSSNGNSNSFAPILPPPPIASTSNSRSAYSEIDNTLSRTRRPSTTGNHPYSSYSPGNIGRELRPVSRRNSSNGASGNLDGLAADWRRNTIGSTEDSPNFNYNRRMNPKSGDLSLIVDATGVSSSKSRLSSLPSPIFDEYRLLANSPSFSSPATSRGIVSLPGSPVGSSDYSEGINSPGIGLIGLAALEISKLNSPGGLNANRRLLAPIIPVGSTGSLLPPLQNRESAGTVEEGLRYACEFCTKRFARPSSLKIHLHSHTGEKPYDCSQCGRSFSVQSNLRRHAKVHEKAAEYRISGPAGSNSNSD